MCAVVVPVNGQTEDGGTRHAIEHAFKRGVPVAAFDYGSRPGVDFRNDPQFAGNVRYLDEDGASPIFEPDTIEKFKARMDEFRRLSDDAAQASAPQASLFD